MNLVVEDVRFAYDKQVVALDGVSLHIVAGESVAIIGENGAGKTTLAKHLNGLLKPDSGEVRVGDWTTVDHSPAELSSRVGFAYQNPDDQLFERTVKREIAFGPRNLGLSQEEVSQRVEAVLELVQLVEHAETHPYDLHLTQRKLVALAATLAMQTPVVILDEPTTGQDTDGIQLLGRIVGDLKRAGRTVITISHDLDFCAEHFDRAVLMAEGRVLAQGSFRQVMQQPAELAKAAVDPPQLARLAAALSLGSTPLTVDEFARAYRQARTGDRS